MGRVAGRRPAGWGDSWNATVANQRARQLRKQLTPQEVKLWVKLRELKQLGYHFRRQSPLGPYIVDFICFGSNLIVEADGGQHGLPEGVERDRIRDAFLRSEGFQILRFWNSDVDQNLEGVMETIFAVLKTPTPASLRSADPPHKGEG